MTVGNAVITGDTAARAVALKLAIEHVSNHKSPVSSGVDKRVLAVAESFAVFIEGRQR